MYYTITWLFFKGNIERIWLFVDKMEKRAKYAELMVNLKKAISNRYYYEAIFIEYAILEDRTESMIRHAGIKFRDGVIVTLDLKLKVIRSNAKFRDYYVKQHIKRDMIEGIMRWKSKRNRLIHDLVNTRYRNKEIEVLANDGYEIVKVFNNKSTLVNKYFDKNKELGVK